MKRLIKLFIVAAIGLVVLTGCRTSTVYNVQKSEIISDENLSNAQVYKAIYAAGATLGWKVTKIKPGLAQAQLNLRDHMALVAIEYNDKDFSINYVDSANIKYNKEKNMIHSNYNVWVQNLQKGINTQITLLGM